MDDWFLTFAAPELHGGEVALDVALDVVCGVEAVGLSLRLAPCGNMTMGFL